MSGSRKLELWSTLHNLQTLSRLEGALSMCLRWSEPLPGSQSSVCFFQPIQLVWSEGVS